MTTLQNLGWRDFFARQISDDTPASLRPARVMAVHRDRLELAGEGVPDSLPLAGRQDDSAVTVGDWIMVDTEAPRLHALLQRFSVFKRRAAGSSAELQLIAANVDTLIIVTSANRDFNIARLERYLALAHEAAAWPLVVISKADTVDNVENYVRAASKLSPGLLVEAFDARDPEAVEVLRPWCGPGQTVALLGSSGVGKSTLINTLVGTEQLTASVRADDQRGRHTTTWRSMHQLPAGGLLIDTPGMRELQLVDVGAGLDDVFAELAAYARSCRFSDCTHQQEPACAVRAAVENGELDAGRLERYRKLLAEERRNSETLAARRSRDRSQGKLYRHIQSSKRREKNVED